MMARSAVFMAAAFVAVSPFPAQEAQRAEGEVAAVVKAVYKALAHPESNELATLLSPDADFRIGGCLVGRGPEAILAALRKRPVWSEVTTPRVEHLSTRFLSSDIAVVDAEQIEYGSVSSRTSTPVMMILQKRGTAWQVVSFRLLAPSASRPPHQQ